jgi:hypothetical protein
VVVSYDLPWNPVRLMQRVGRIDRLGAAADAVELYHFVPGRELDRLLGLMARLQGKLGTIRRALGLEHPVLAGPGGVERELDRVRILAHDPDGYERVEAEIEGPLDPEEQAYIDHVERAAAGTPAGLPPVVATLLDDSAAAARAAAYWRVTAGRQVRGLWMTCSLDSGCVIEDQAAALAIFRAGADLPPGDPDARTVECARRAFARHAGGVITQLEAARIAGDALSPGLPQCRIAAWLSRRYQSALRISRRERAAIDRLLERLARRFSLAGERALAAVADALPPQPDGRWLDRFEAQLEEIDERGNAMLELREIAVLVVLPRRRPSRPLPKRRSRR